MSSTLPVEDLPGTVDDPLYPRLKEYVVQATGMAYYGDKDADLSRRLGRRFAATRMHDCASYLDLLRDPLLGPHELDALIGEVTIGETYFFRHPEHFDALRAQVLPDLIARNRLKRSLRIWCAGCADGPEPYSLSILLKRDLAGPLAGWDVTILGTDINRQRLARAREGRFEEWALRSIDPELRDKCFVKDARSWAIAREYTEGVSFQYHNLVEDCFPAAVNLDLIVCRNVTIYFGPALVTGILQRFHQCLAPGAWLLVGPSEPNMTSFGSFRAVNAPGVTLYQKEDQPARGPETAWFAVLPLENPAPPAMIRPRPPEVEGSGTLAQARAFADRGDWEAAARCCEDLLRMDSLNARNHFHYGLVLEQMGKCDQAEAAFKRAIYLDRQLVLAHYYFGLFSRSRGDSRRAGRCFQNALDLLRTKGDDETFPDADGITASELRRLAAMQLEMLGDRT